MVSTHWIYLAIDTRSDIVLLFVVGDIVDAAMQLLPLLLLMIILQHIRTMCLMSHV
jgi:hypothetical protein